MKKTSISLFRINAGDRASGLGPKKQPDGSDGTALPCLRDWVSDYRCGLVPYVFDISLAKYWRRERDSLTAIPRNVRQ